MHDLHAVDIPRSQIVQCHYKFGVMVPDFQEITDFPVRIFGQLTTDLHINSNQNRQKLKNVSKSLLKKTKH